MAIAIALSRRSMTSRIELYLSQRLLVFEHVHVGYRLLPVSPTSLISSGVVSHDRLVLSHLALIHTAHLLSCLATAVSTTETPEDQTGVRPGSDTSRTSHGLFGCNPARYGNLYGHW